MFTGLIEESSKVIERIGSELAVERPSHMDLAIGDSVAVNGCCLTVTEKLDARRIVFEVSAETDAKTSLGDVDRGDFLNLERAMKLGDRFGGHWVSGHVDACGQVSSIERLGDFFEVKLKLPDNLLPYTVEKGSVCVDGVSLTINSIQDNEVSLMLIPTTLQATNLGSLVIGQRVNIEVDILGKYVERLLKFNNQNKH